MPVTTQLRQLLQFSRLSVLGYEFEGADLIVKVAIRGRARCPGCGQIRSLYDRRPAHCWRHLDLGAHRCFLEGDLRRVSCPRCGVGTEAASWAAPKSGFSLPFEDLVGWLPQRNDKTTISTLLGIAWRTVGAILTRVLDCHMEAIDLSKLQDISIDEQS